MNSSLKLFSYLKAGTVGSVLHFTDLLWLLECCSSSGGWQLTENLSIFRELRLSAVC